MAKEYVDMSTPVIEMRNIVKKFGDFVANDGINLTVHKGEIHAILGENGAGKSTLMNQLYGLLKPTSGDILVNGKKIVMNNPRDAIDAGIGMVHWTWALQGKTLSRFLNDMACLSIRMQKLRIFPLGCSSALRYSKHSTGVQIF